MTILSGRAVQLLILREITAAGGSIDEHALTLRLDAAGVDRDHARRDIRHLSQTLGRLVRIDDSLRIPTRYLGDEPVAETRSPAPRRQGGTSTPTAGSTR